MLPASRRHDSRVLDSDAILSVPDAFYFSSGRVLRVIRIILVDCVIPGRKHRRMIVAGR